MTENQAIFNWDSETADNNREFVDFGEKVSEVTVKFEENDPFFVGIPAGSEYKNKKYMFKVQTAGEEGYEEKVLSFSAKRLLQALFEIRPLANKTVLIKRAGTGINTQFTAEVL